MCYIYKYISVKRFCPIVQDHSGLIKKKQNSTFLPPTPRYWQEHVDSILSPNIKLPLCEETPAAIILQK